MTSPREIGQRARELLAAEYEAANRPLVAIDIRTNNIGGEGVRWFEAKIVLRAIEAALRLPAPPVSDTGERE